jgi:hypothetical protein
MSAYGHTAVVRTSRRLFPDSLRDWPGKALSPRKNYIAAEAISLCRFLSRRFVIHELRL